MIDRFAAGAYRVPVLYLDNHLLVVEKPPNLPVQADDSGDVDLLSAAKQFIGEKFQKPGQVYLGLVHRLDRPVGGVMVLARTSKAAARLSKAFAEHTIEKKYLAILQGEMNIPMHMVDYLKKDERAHSSRVVDKDTPGAKIARLTSTPIGVCDGMTLSEVELMTGRAHQIRVQHRHATFPLWGDARYGGGKPGQQIALWAYALRFAHPTKDETMRFVCRPPNLGAWTVFYDQIEKMQ